MSTWATSTLFTSRYPELELELPAGVRTLIPDTAVQRVQELPGVVVETDPETLSPTE